MKIRQLQLYTARLDEQFDFYGRLLGLPVINRTDSTFTVTIGNSLLTFHARQNSTPYHFAINVPSNKIADSLEWLKSKVTILTDDDREIQNFDAWNAKAVYFYDRDQNIVEFIARGNLDNKSYDPFTVAQLLEISEIGVPVHDLNVLYKAVTTRTKIPVYSGSPDRFCALGDEQGLFICIDKDKKEWYPTGDKAYSSDFVLHFSSDQNYVAEFYNGRMEVSDNT